MGNQASGRIWVLDTADAQNNVYGGQIFVAAMEFHPAAAGNDCHVQDGAGKTIWQVRAIADAPNHEAAGIEKWINPAPNVPFNGLRLAALTAGSVRIMVI